MTLHGATQRYSAGNKVYGMGRSNPTSGPVDPIGYRERDAKKMMTSPMQQALTRRIGTTPAPAPAQHLQPAWMSAPGVPGAGPIPNANQLVPNAMGHYQPAPAAPVAGQGTSGIDPGVLGRLNAQNAVNHPGAGSAPSGYMDPAHAPTPAGSVNDGGLAAYNARAGQMPNTSDYNHPYSVGPDGRLVAFQANDETLRNTDFDPLRDRSLYSNGTYNGPGTPGYNAAAHPGVNGYGQRAGTGGEGYYPSSNAGTAPPPAQSGVEGLPFDPAYAGAQNAAQMQLAEAQQALGNGQHNAQTNAYGENRDIDRNAQDRYRNLIDQFAERGLAHSGAYATQYGNTAANIAGQHTQVNQGLNDQLNQLLGSYSGARNDVYGNQQNSLMEMIARMAGNAGNLGLQSSQGINGPQAPDYQSILQRLIGR